MPGSRRDALREALVKAIEFTPERKFKQTVELIVVFKDVDPKSAEGRIRETTFLPKGLGKERSICVVADGEMALKARESGAKIVLTSEELRGIDKKSAKKIAQQCDWVLVKTDLMSLVGRVLGPALGPRGKIPVPVPPNADIQAFIKRYSSAVLVRNKDQPQVMVPIGVEDMSVEDLVENAEAVLSILESKLPNGVQNIAKVLVKTTMGPPIPVVW